MKSIGITGGVGSGKSELLSHIRDKYRCKIILSDLLAKELQEKGRSCYGPLVTLLGTEILDENGNIRKDKMAERIFSDEALLTKVNEIIHPAVVKAIVDDMNESKKSGCFDFFFVEAALLIETGFDKICDELWYIYAREDVRRTRLKASRGYGDEKITAIMKKQLSEEDFRKHCDVVIDNSDTLEKSYEQIDRILEGYLWHR